MNRRDGQGLLRRKVRYKFQGKVDVNKFLIQFLCPVPAVGAKFFKFAHIASDSHVDLFNGFLLDVLVFKDKIFNHDGV